MTSSRTARRQGRESRCSSFVTDMAVTLVGGVLVAGCGAVRTRSRRAEQPRQAKDDHGGDKAAQAAAPTARMRTRKRRTWRTRS